MVCCIKKQSRSLKYKIIDKLLRSKDYLGRDVCIKDPEAFLKNERICKLIDIIRYEDSDELIRKIIEKLRRSKILIDGGDAATTYKYYERLDLGGAGCPVAELDIKGCEFRNIDGGNAFDQYSEKYKLDLGFSSSDKATIEFPRDINQYINCGYSDTIYCPNNTIDLRGAVEECFIPSELGNVKITSN